MSKGWHFRQFCPGFRVFCLHQFWPGFSKIGCCLAWPVGGENFRSEISRTYKRRLSRYSDGDDGGGDAARKIGL